MDLPREPEPDTQTSSDGAREPTTKGQVCEWLVETVKRLNELIDAAESELEAPEDHSKESSYPLEQIRRHRLHAKKLETILRDVESGETSHYEVIPIREPVEQYLTHYADDSYEDTVPYGCLIPADFTDSLASPPSPVHSEQAEQAEQAEQTEQTEQNEQTELTFELASESKQKPKKAGNMRRKELTETAKPQQLPPPAATCIDFWDAEGTMPPRRSDKERMDRLKGKRGDRFREGPRQQQRKWNAAGRPNGSGPRWAAGAEWEASPGRPNGEYAHMAAQVWSQYFRRQDRPGTSGRSNTQTESRSDANSYNTHVYNPTTDWNQQPGRGTYSSREMYAASANTYGPPRGHPRNSQDPSRVVARFSGNTFGGGNVLQQLAQFVHPEDQSGEGQHGRPETPPPEGTILEVLLAQLTNDVPMNSASTYNTSRNVPYGTADWTEEATSGANWSTTPGRPGDQVGTTWNSQTVSPPMGTVWTDQGVNWTEHPPIWSDHRDWSEHPAQGMEAWEQIPDVNWIDPTTGLGWDHHSGDWTDLQAMDANWMGQPGATGDWMCQNTSDVNEWDAHSSAAAQANWSVQDPPSSSEQSYQYSSHWA